MWRSIRSLTQVIVFGLVLAAPGWGNVGFDGGRTSNSPLEQSITPDAARHLKVRWHANLGTSKLPPVANAGRVFAIAQVGSESEVRAYSGANGGCNGGTCTPLWSVRQPLLNTLVLAAGQVQSGGAVYVDFPHDPTGFGWRYYGGAYDPSTGASRGREAATDEQLPVVADGCVYGYDDSVVYMGTPYPYLYTTLVRKSASSGCSDARIESSVGLFSLAVVGHRIFQLTGDEVWVSDETPDRCQFPSSCGGNLWTARLSAGAAVDALPTVTHGRLFVPTLDGTVDVFSTSGCGHYVCSPLYRLRAGSVHMGALAVTDTRVFAASDDGHLYAFRPAGCGESVCAPTWTADLRTPLHSPSVAGDVVYVPSDDGRVFTVDARGCGAKSCNALGSASTGARIRWAPVISAGRVYVVNDANELYALGAS